jgi:hypothetical protein
MLDWLGTLAIAAVLTTLFALSLGIGWRLMRRRDRGASDGASDGASTGAGYIVGSTLGLMSLLIGFTLALSLDRYEVRRRLVGEEASAIQTAWLRDSLLDQPYRSQLDGLLRAYIRGRRLLPLAGLDPAALDAQDRRSEAMQQRIWQVTAQALSTPNDARMTTVVLQATNAMFDAPSARRAALDAQVPSPVLAALVIVATIAAAITGYGLAAGGHRHRIASLGLFMVAALIIALIIELDEPESGFIRVSQAPFDRVADAILSAPPAK